MGQQPGGTPNLPQRPAKSSTTAAGLCCIKQGKSCYDGNMRVLFERRGGLAGTKLDLSLDADLLPAQDALRLKSLLEDSRFFELPGKLAPRGTQPDRFTYRVTVESEKGIRIVEAAESAVPAEMRPLLDWLTRSSRTK
jgi:hypothetical protein